MRVEEQVLILYAISNNFLTDINLGYISEFEKELMKFADTHYRDMLKSIKTEGSLTKEVKCDMEECISEFKKIFTENE